MDKKRKREIICLIIILVAAVACNSNKSIYQRYSKIYSRNNTTFAYSDINPAKGSFKVDTGIYFGRLENICVLQSGTKQLDSLVYFLLNNPELKVKIEINNYGISKMDSRDYGCQSDFIANYLLVKRVDKKQFSVFQNLGQKPIIRREEVKNLKLGQQQKWLSLNNRLDLTII